MPTYSYRCTECANAFDAQQAFTDDSLTVCPVCGGMLRKVFSPVGVTFSGSGFYRTDSRAKPSDSRPSGSSDSSGSSGSPDSSAPAKKDASPAKKESAAASKPAAAPASASTSSGH